jgi:surface polysaccharide O-acyltransferase-like enzyme
MNTTKRNSGIELYRILLMFLIVLLHFFAHGYGLLFETVASSDLQPTNWSVFSGFHIALYSVCMIGVTGFMFISGYYGMNFSLSKGWNLWTQALFYAVVLYLIISILNKDFQIGSFFHAFFPLSSGGWWFLQSYFIVYLLSPVINAGLEKISNVRYSFLLIVLFVFLYVGSFIASAMSRTTILLLFIYLFGQYIKRNNALLCWLKANSLWMSACSLLFLALPPYLFWEFHLFKLLKLFLSNYNFLILLAATSLFFVFERINFHSSTINKWSANVFAVYLITDYGLMRRIIMNNLININITPPIFNFCLEIAIIMLFCVLIEEVRKVVMSPISDKILHKVTIVANHLAMLVTDKFKNQ